MQTNPAAQLKAITTMYGHRMLVDPTDFIGQEAIAKGIYDHPSIDLIRNILGTQRCRTILDIGANIGNHSLAFSQLCARLLAFEPGQRAFEILKANIENNGLHNTKALNFGLSNADGAADLYINAAGNLGGSSLEQANAPDGASTEKVSLKIGDAYLASQQIHDVDFIKIDVEGHEQNVFQGLKATLHQCRPLILMEWDDEDSNRSWILDTNSSKELFPDYQTFALIWNSNKHYWSSKPLGILRRNLIRLTTRKHKALAKFDPVGHQTRVNDLLLVPNEKLPCVSQYIYR